MALLVSFDKGAKLLARQVFGVVDAETQGYAEDALELALQEIEQETHLISQEGDGTLALTGANQYDLSDIDLTILRIVKAKTKWGAVEVMRKAEFMTKFPDHESYSTGLPRNLVLWGNDSLYVWPDQAATTLTVIFYKLMEKSMAGSIMSKLLDIARGFVETDPNTRGINRIQRMEALRNVNKSQTRATDSPLRFLVEHRVNVINHFKRSRR